MTYYRRQGQKPTPRVWEPLPPPTFPLDPDAAAPNVTWYYDEVDDSTHGSGQRFGAATVIVSATAPAGPIEGLLWFCTTDLQLYIWWTDASGSSQWTITVNRPPATGGSPPATATLTISHVNDQVVSTLFAISGTFTGTAPTSIDYSINGGSTWLSLPGVSVGSGTWSGNAVSNVTGPQTIMVRETNATSVTATSNTYTVTAATGGSARLAFNAAANSQYLGGVI